MSIQIVTAENEIFTAPLELIIEDKWSDYYLLLHDQHCNVFRHLNWGYNVPRSLLYQDDALNDKRGYPEMVPCANRYWMSLTQTIQIAWFELCIYMRHKRVDWWNLSEEEQKRMATQWSTFTDSKRFATNHKGTDICNNYVMAAVMKDKGYIQRGEDAMQSSVLCGGNVVLALGHEPIYINRIAHIKIAVWDGINPAPNAITFNWNTHPHLVHLATNSTPFNLAGAWSKTGPWRVDKFPFFDGVGSPYYVYSDQPQYIALNRVRRLKKSELFPNRYVPAQ